MLMKMLMKIIMKITMKMLMKMLTKMFIGTFKKTANFKNTRKTFILANQTWKYQFTTSTIM